jgi:hypothetical protein
LALRVGLAVKGFHHNCRAGIKIEKSSGDDRLVRTAAAEIRVRGSGRLERDRQTAGRLVANQGGG